MITTDIKTQIVSAMKARDQLRLGTLKMLSSELHNEIIDKQRDLTEEEEFAVIRREVKKRRDAIDAYTKAGSPERAANEEQEMKILEEFLPAQMSEDDLSKVIDEIITETGASSIAQMGQVIGGVKTKVGAQADGATIANLVRAKLHG